MGNDGIDDNKVYTVNTNVQSSGKAPLVFLESQIKFEGTVSEVKMTFTGNANSENSKQADGKLNVIQELNNGKQFTRMSIDAVGGPYGNGAPPNGNYTVDGPRQRTESGYKRGGFGFSFNVNPLFETKRADLRIHPDGNSLGTLGCIGLQCNKSQGKSFYNLLSNEIKQNGALNLNININGNLNNQGGGVVPLINE
ncbi:MAG: hypothetical protein ABI315_09500 [Bacteroidia bacterium]